MIIIIITKNNNNNKEEEEEWHAAVRATVLTQSVSVADVPGQVVDVFLVIPVPLVDVRM